MPREGEARGREGRVWVGAPGRWCECVRDSLAARRHSCLHLRGAHPIPSCPCLIWWLDTADFGLVVFPILFFFLNLAMSRGYVVYRTD
eukprot:8371722-Pyramimonas_sp.AAC.1